jgi:hypothetical protein
MTNTYTVEYRITVEGTIEVDAESAQDAEDMVNDGKIDCYADGDHSYEDTEVQDTYRTDGTSVCDTCNYDDDECICEYCDECDRLVDDCECDEEDEEEEND